MCPRSRRKNSQIGSVHHGIKRLHLERLSKLKSGQFHWLLSLKTLHINHLGDLLFKRILSELCAMIDDLGIYICLKICFPGKQREKCPGQKWGWGGLSEGSRTGQREALNSNAQASEVGEVGGGGRGEDPSDPRAGLELDDLAVVLPWGKGFYRSATQPKGWVLQGKGCDLWLAVIFESSSQRRTHWEPAEVSAGDPQL